MRAVNLHDLVAVAAGDALVRQAAILVDGLGGLADDILILDVRSHIGDVVGNVVRLVVDGAERRLNEAVLVDAGIGREVGDQADVRAFRRLDGAPAAVVAVVHVSDLHVRALAGEAAGAQSGQTALVRQLGQRVRLVHELAQGAGAEELLDRRRDGADVDQALRGDDVEILNRHALADDALHTAKADAELVLQQLAHAAQAAVAEVVDVVLRDKAAGQRVHIVDGGEDIVDNDVLGHQLVGMELTLLDELLALVLAQQILQHTKAHALLDAALLARVKVHIVAHVAHLVGEHADHVAVFELHGDLADADGVHLAAVVAGQDVALVEEDLAGGGVGHGHGQLLTLHARPERQLLVELIAADGAQVIAAGIEEEVLDQRLGGVERRRLAGAELAVDLHHGLLIGLAGILLEGGNDARIVAEAVEDLGIGLETERADETGDGELAVLVDTDPEHLAGVRLILEPRAAIGDDGARQQRQVGLEVDLLAVVDAGGADDLGDDHALGAVDDKRTGLGHQREIAHEDLLLLDLARLLVVQADAHLHRGGIRRVAGLALLHVILGRLVHAVIEEAQLQITGIVRDGRHVREHLAQAGVQEPLIGVLLDRQQVGHRHDLFVSGKVLAQGLAVVLVLGHLQYSRLSFSIFGSAPRRAPPVRCASYTKGNSSSSAATRTGLLRVFRAARL